MKHTMLVLFCLGLFLNSVLAQNDHGNDVDVKVKKIDATLTPAPRYSLQGALPTVDPSKRWLVVEADLQVAPEWADEITVKFFVAAFYGSTVKNAPEDGYDVLSASVTVSNVPRNVGSARHALVPVFLDANTVKKYEPTGVDKFIQDVVVQVYYKGVLQETKWMKSEDHGRFWEKKQPRPGLLLNFLQSPWFPAYVDHYEQVKQVSSSSL